MIVAIDGPAGAGKSTVALRVAEELSYRLISTGALYRAVAWSAAQESVALDESARLALIAAALDVEFRVVDGINRVGVGDHDVTEELRTPQISLGASIVSAIPEVRNALTDLQRSYAKTMDVVMEGRDIGTVIFPDAATKVFLTATAEERARRRMADYAGAGESQVFDEVLREIVERDQRDSTRAVAPLKPAADSVVIDATKLSIDEVVTRIVELARAAAADEVRAG
jgi:cytidylate kinase